MHGQFYEGCGSRLALYIALILIQKKRYYLAMTSPLPQLTFTAQIFKEGKQFVSFNPELRVASCGNTAEKAKKNLKDAIRGFMLSAHKKGTLPNILEEAGFIQQKKSWRDPDLISLDRMTVAV